MGKSTIKLWFSIATFDNTGESPESSGILIQSSWSFSLCQTGDLWHFMTLGTLRWLHVPGSARAHPSTSGSTSRNPTSSSFQPPTRPGRPGRRHGVKTELVYANMGPHGHPMSDLWTSPCEAWLRANGWAPNGRSLVGSGGDRVEPGWAKTYSRVYTGLMKDVRL